LFAGLLSIWEPLFAVIVQDSKMLFQSQQAAGLFLSLALIAILKLLGPFWPDSVIAAPLSLPVKYNKTTTFLDSPSQGPRPFDLFWILVDTLSDAVSFIWK
jgi:hypothetical protein